MGVVQDAVTRIVNVHWGSKPPEIVSLSLGFTMSKPFGIGDWVGYLTMSTKVVGLPTLSRTSFSVAAIAGLPGELQQVTGEWTVNDKIVIGSARLSSESLFQGNMSYRFDTESVPANVVMELTGTAPLIVDVNGVVMDVPVNVFANGNDSQISNPFVQQHKVIAGGGRFTAKFEVRIKEPPAMSLSLT